MKANSSLIILGIALGISGDYGDGTREFLLMPAGFAFAIWLLIYAGMLRLALHYWRGESFSMGLWPGLAFFTSGLWSRVGLLGSTVLSLSVAFLTLILSIGLLKIWYRRSPSPAEKSIALRPLSLYAGWISVANIVWGSALMFEEGYQFFNSITGAVFFATLALTLALLRPSLWSRAFSLAIGWGLFGIAVECRELSFGFSVLCFVYTGLVIAAATLQKNQVR